jgi:excisionase family DNA binding protein
MTTTLEALDGVPPESIPAAIAHLSARLLAAPQAPAADELLTPDEAARLLRSDRRFCYRHARELGAIRLSRRKLRFSRRRVERWLATKGR